MEPISADELRKNSAETASRVIAEKSRIIAEKLEQNRPMYTAWLETARENVITQSKTKIDRCAYIHVPPEFVAFPEQIEVCVSALTDMFPGTNVRYERAFSMINVGW